MALTIDKIKEINIPINVSRKPDNFPTASRGIAPYNDSVNLYEALQLLVGNIPPANITIGDGLIGNGSPLSPLSWAGANTTSALTGSGTVLMPLDISNKGVTLGKLAQSGATVNQIIKWDGTNWVPGNETGGATSFVPLTRTLTINGTTYDLSQDRSWNITSMIYPPAGIPVSTGSAWGTSITNNSTNWNTAFSWGNHALAGYLTGTAIGTTVQPYNANTVIDAAYVHTDNNYTTAEKSKLAGIAAGAEVNVNADWNATSGDAQILNKPTIPTQVLVDAIPTDGSNNAVSSNGVFDALASKADLVGGKVPTSQLPSYVDDVIEGYYNAPAFYSDAGLTTIINGETGKIYVDLLQNKSYRWTGSLYIQISNAISSINDLTDVTIASPNNGQILRYNSTNTQWENVTVPIGNGDMQKTTYDTDDDGVVDYAETVAVDVRNPSTSDILRRGTIVYLNGSTGNRPNAYKAQADAEATSSGTFGVVVADIGLNTDGRVAALGTLHNLDTRTAAGGATYPFTSDTLLDGDAIWLSPTTAGYVTRVKPTAPNHAVFIGIVARTSPTNGRIIYRIQNGYELEELHNVAISNIQPNQVIKYDGTKWINATTPAAGNNTEVQYNNSGSLGASSNFTWDNVNQTLNLITPVGNSSPSLSLKATDIDATGQYNITQGTSKQSGGGSNYILLSELNFNSYANNNYITTPLKIATLVNVLSGSTVLQSSTVTVNGTLKITNIPTTVTTASGLLGITDEDNLFKTSLGSSLTLSSTGTLDVSTLSFNKITAGQAQLSGSQNIAINYSNSNSGLLVSNGGYSVLGSPDGLKTLTVDNTGVYTTSSTAIGTNSINPNAILSLNSTTKGLLLPAVNTTDRDNMVSPSSGIMIYNPSVGKFQGRAGNAWVDFGGGGGGTPAGSTGQVQYNNAGAFGASSNLFWDNTNARLGIGTSTPASPLNVFRSTDAEIRSSVTNAFCSFTAFAPLSGYPRSAFLIGNSSGDVNTGLVVAPFFDDKQTFLEIRSYKSGTDSRSRNGVLYNSPTSGFLINASSGDGNTGGLPIVISTRDYGSAYANPAIYVNTSANSQRVGINSTTTNGQLHVKGSGPTAGTWTAQFHNSSGSSNTLMIRDDGNVGIGTASPSYKLDVSGTIRGNLINEINVQTASYTLALSDANKIIEMNVATANTLTVPENTTANFPIGTNITIIQAGAGQTTILAAATVVIQSANGWTKINAQYGAVTLVKKDANTWYLFGNLNA